MNLTTQNKNTPANDNVNLGIAGKINRWLKVRRMERYLSQFDDRTLYDIGINRYDIHDQAVKLVNQNYKNVA